MSGEVTMNTLNPTPAAVVAPATTPSVVEQWRAVRDHDYLDHVAYAMARVLHSRLDDRAPTLDEASALARKLVRTLPPVTNPIKLANGRKRWQTLQHALDYFSRGARVYEKVYGEDAVTQVRDRSIELLKVLRSDPAFFERFVPLAPPPRPKQPYVRGE